MKKLVYPLLIVGLFLFSQQFACAEHLVQRPSFENENVDLKSPFNSNVYVDKSLEDNDWLQLNATKQSEHQDALHIFSHGESGQLYLEGEWKHAAQIVDWLKQNYTLSNFSEINFYGCEFAQGSTGQQAMQYLEKELNIDIAASNDITGADDGINLIDAVVYELLDLQGRVVYTQKRITDVKNDQILIPLISLSKGVYILRVSNHKFQNQNKIVLE